MESTSRPSSSSNIAPSGERTRKCLAEMKALYGNKGLLVPVILIMGPAGAGKSSLFEDLTDSTGHSEQRHESVASSFEIEKAVLHSKEYFVMDTPSFHPNTEEQTFREIIRGLEAIRSFSYIAGVLYVTRINQQRFDEFDERLVCFMHEFCGQGYPNLTLVTTFWTAQSHEKAQFNSNLKTLQSKFQDADDSTQLRSYQHGREYPPGQDTERFLDWHKNRDEMAQFAKDMIIRSYGGQAGDRWPHTPKIIQELNTATKIYDTVAGKLLKIPIDESRPRLGQETRPEPAGNNTRTDTASPANTSNTSERSLYDNVVGFSSWAIRNHGEQIVQVAGTVWNNFFSRGSPSHNGPRDPNSVVDLMKSRGMDSSLDARKSYAAAHGIGGTAGSADWNIKIRNHINGGRR